MFCFLVLRSFLFFFNHLEVQEIAGCFAKFVFLVYVAINVLWLFLTVYCDGIQRVIMAIS